MGDVLLYFSMALEPLLFVVNSGKRIFWLYLLSSAVIALVASKIATGSIRDACTKLFSLTLWLHPSSKADFKWLFFNHVIRATLVLPVLGGSVALALGIYRLFSNIFGEGNFWAPADFWVMIGFTFTLFIFEDFTRFLVHYSFHKIPFLWRFHAVHHQAEILTPITLYRIHWFEMMLNSLRSLFVIGGTSGIFMYCFENTISAYEIMGASLFAFLFNLAGANLRHSAIWIGFGWFENIFISPAQHQIHHSTALVHRDKNFGATLSIWDRLFNSHVFSKQQNVQRYGLDDARQNEDHSLLKSFWGIKT